MKILLRWLLASFLLVYPAAPGLAAGAPAPANDKINVSIYYGDGTQAQWANRTLAVTVKNGTTAMEAVKQAGMEKRLTNATLLEINPNPAPTSKDDESPAIVDVGAVREGKAKDVTLMQDSANHRMDISIKYKDYQFTGGTPGDFAASVIDHFGLDWSILQLPREQNNARVPAFRVGSDDGAEAYTVIMLYNAIARRFPAIGQWNWEGQLYKPQIVMLAPDKSAPTATAPALKVKALSLAGINPSRWDRLVRDIREAQDRAMAYQADTKSSDNVLFEGNTSVQSDSKILVTVGTPAYIDLVESMVTAYEKNAAVVKDFP